MAANGRRYRDRAAGDRPYRVRAADDRPYRVRAADDRPYRVRAADDRRCGRGRRYETSRPLSRRRTVSAWAAVSLSWVMTRMPRPFSCSRCRTP